MVLKYQNEIKTSGSRHYRPAPISAYGIIYLGPIFATRKVVAPFSNIQSSWADQYGSIDTWNIKIRPLVTILWPNILGDQQGALNSLLTTIPNRNYRSDRPGGLILYCTALFCTVLYKNRRMKEGKIRKFDDKEQADKDGIQTLRPLYLYPLWILEGVGQ